MIQFTVWATSAQAEVFEEGVHYQELPGERSDTAQIIEFFSLYCGSCYQYQPFTAMIKDKWPGILTQQHVSSLTPSGFERSVQEAWAAARLLEVEQSFAERVFDLNFVQRRQVADQEQIYQVFNSLGIERERVEQILSSFQVRSLVRQMQLQEERFGVRGTPTFIVNQKYMMDYRGFRDSEDFFADYLALAEYLLNK
ncbi:thiol:disulfide interchange protein DsbA/DsbL [Aliidiomarina soli]|uniref:thiol:disulfide interchange protein DsbA/DsbL n=1 Tax=Aliidiomarina soli TaxID=1928574 RepID=UPI00130085A7|nr:thiol:disulfide interchange protein DsbA/DsbL [Aliidiomarina soli]